MLSTAIRCEVVIVAVPVMTGRWADCALRLAVRVAVHVAAVTRSERILPRLLHRA